MRNLFKFVALAALSLATAASVSAQASPRTGGFHFGAALNGTAIKVDDDEFSESETENGPGLSLHAGYNFTPMLGVFLGLTGASIGAEGGDYVLSHGDIGVRVSLGSSSVVPDLEAAFSGLNAQGESEFGDIEYRGTGLTGGLGLNYFLTSRLALDVSFKYTKGEFNTVKVDDEKISVDDGLGVSSGRFNIGIAFYPSASRGSRLSRR